MCILLCCISARCMYLHWWLGVDFPSHWRLIPWPYRWLIHGCRVCSLVCQVQLPSSALAEALMPLFYYSRKQAGKRKPGHMDKLQSERGSQARGHRKSVQAQQLSTSTAKVFFFFSLSLSLSHSAVTVVLLYMQWRSVETATTKT